MKVGLVSSISNFFINKYYKCWSYKCYNPHFLDCTGLINVFSFIFLKNLIFHLIKNVFWCKTSTYIHWKLKEHFTNSMYNRTSTYNRNLRVVLFDSRLIVDICSILSLLARFLAKLLSLTFSMKYICKNNRFFEKWPKLVQEVTGKLVLGQ